MKFHTLKTVQKQANVDSDVSSDADVTVTVGSQAYETVSHNNL